MGKVILSIEEYEDLRKQADLKECFSLKKNYDDSRINLTISQDKAVSIFNELFSTSKFKDDYVIVENSTNFNIEIADFYIKAVRKSDDVKEGEEI